MNNIELESFNDKFTKLVINDPTYPLLITFQGHSTEILQKFIDKYTDPILGYQNIDSIDELPFYMYNTFTKNVIIKYNFLFVKDDSQLWYSLYFNKILDKLKMIINKLKPNKIVCIGDSAGGYAAILFGNSFPVDKIVAFNPQITSFEGIFCLYYHK